MYQIAVMRLPWDTGEAVPTLAGCRLTADQALACYPGADQQRLRAVERVVDPDDMFRFGNGIGC